MVLTRAASPKWIKPFVFGVVSQVVKVNNWLIFIRRCQMIVDWACRNQKLNFIKIAHLTRVIGSIYIYRALVFRVDFYVSSSYIAVFLSGCYCEVDHQCHYCCVYWASTCLLHSHLIRSVTPNWASIDLIVALNIDFHTVVWKPTWNIRNILEYFIVDLIIV